MTERTPVPILSIARHKAIKHLESSLNTARAEIHRLNALKTQIECELAQAWCAKQKDQLLETLKIIDELIEKAYVVLELCDFVHTNIVPANEA